MERKKVRFGELRKDWAAFKILFAREEGMNIFVYLYSCFAALLVWAVLVVAPAYCSLYLLFLMAALNSGVPLEFYTGYLFGLVGMLGLPSLLFMWNEAAHYYQAEFKKLRRGIK